MYADAFGLLVFGPFLTSVSLSKNMFFDRLGNAFMHSGDFATQNHIAGRQLFGIFLRKIRKCITFSAERMNPFPTMPMPFQFLFVAPGNDTGQIFMAVEIWEPESEIACRRCRPNFNLSGILCKCESWWETSVNVKNNQKEAVFFVYFARTQKAGNAGL